METVRSQPRPAAALLRPATLPEVEPDGTEDPWANADDGVLPGPADKAPRHPPSSPEKHMHKPQDTPPIEVPPLDPTPPQDPVPHQNPVADKP